MRIRTVKQTTLELDDGTLVDVKYSDIIGLMSSLIEAYPELHDRCMRAINSRNMYR